MSTSAYSKFWIGGDIESFRSQTLRSRTTPRSLRHFRQVSAWYTRVELRHRTISGAFSWTQTVVHLGQADLLATVYTSCTKSRSWRYFHAWTSRITQSDAEERSECHRAEQIIAPQGKKYCNSDGRKAFLTDHLSHNGLLLLSYSLNDNHFLATSWSYQI